MLQSIRDHAGSWFIKVLLGAIIASFAIWGISDIIRNYHADKPVVKIGSQKISIDTFSNAYRDAISHIQQASKEPIPAEALKQLNIQEKVIDQLINQALIEKAKDDLKLAVSNKTITQYIQSIPELKKNGEFDQDAFLHVLQRNNMTQGQFLKDMRKNLINLQLLSPFINAFKLPNAYVDILFKALEEEKVFIVLPIPLSKMSVTVQPSEEELKIYYEQNQSSFTRPEYREISLLKLDMNYVKNRISVDEAQVKQEYEKRLSDFTKKEQREVKQLTLISKSVAQEALALLEKGRPASAAARDVKGEFHDIGLMEKDQLSLPDHQKEAIFALSIGKPSSIIESPLGWHIYVVTRIEPEKVKTFEEVKDKIASELKEISVPDEVYEVRNRIEDKLASGSKLSEVAKEFKMSLVTFNAFDKNGLDSEGKQSLPEDLRASVIKTTFETSANQESSFVDLKGGEGYVLSVDKVIASYQPSLEEVKKDVKEAWLNERRFEEAAKLAKELSKNIKSNADLSKAALQYKFVAKVLEPISRTSAEKEAQVRQYLSPDLLRSMFTLKVNESTYGQNREGFVVVLLNKVLPLNEKNMNDKREKIEQGLQTMTSKDVEQQFLISQRHHAAIDIDQKLVENLTNRE